MFGFGLSTGVREHLGDFGGKGRDDGGVEERIETCEDNTADYDTDDDLDTGVDVALAGCVGNGGLGVDGGLGECVLDGIDKLLHVKYLFP